MQAIGGQRKLVLQASDREARAILQSRILELEAELEGHKEELGKILRVEEELTRELKTAQEKEATLVRLEVDYQPLSQAAAEAARRYEEVHTRYAETALANQLETNNVRIQDLAQAPTRPVKPNRSLNMAVGIVIGLLLGIGMVFFVESLDSTLKTREDIELAVPNLSFLGLVPAVSETGAREDGAESVRQLFVHLYPKSNITESFRTVRTNLLFATPNRKPRVIVVTSPGAKEGKTTVTANLAAISAVSGSRTVIIDTDMRRPRVHKLLGLPRRPGITECYFSSEPVSRFVQSTGVEGLDVLTCGALSANPVEIIESARFRNMIDELLGLYDTVFLDSPPVLAVADAKIVASMVEVVVMVVRAGVTARDSLREAVGLLEPVMGDSIGVVLNCFDVEKHSYRYYYYRSKKYSYYSYYSYGDPEVDNQLVDGRPDTTGTPTASSSAGDPQLLDSERDRGA
jgi:capsular exopolysaccharide synthesis family protein